MIGATDRNKNNSGRSTNKGTNSAGSRRAKGNDKNTVKKRRNLSPAELAGLKEKKELIKTPEYVAYLDTEFNAFDFYGQNEGKQEIVEIGLTVMHKGEVVDGFRSFCALKHGHVLTKRTEQLTGISRANVVNAPHFADVVNSMNVFLDMYNPAQIYAYGTEDRVQLLRTAEIYKLGSQELYYIDKIKDITKLISARLGAYTKIKMQLSVKDLCAVCGISSKGIHDAYNDALYLGRCAEKIMNGNVNTARLSKVLSDKVWLSGYRSARRIKEKRSKILLNDAQLEPVRYALTRVGEEHLYQDFQLKALWDDLRMITGRAPEYE